MSVQQLNEKLEPGFNLVPATSQVNVSGLKTVELSGVQREIERICIDDPSALDKEIQKYQCLKKSANTKQIAWVIAAIVTALAIDAIGIGLLLTGGPLWIAPVTKIAFVLTFIPLMMISEIHRDKAAEHNNKITKLQSCQKVMKQPWFRLKVESSYGKNLELDQLLKVCHLFQKSEFIIDSIERFKEDLRKMEFEVPCSNKFPMLWIPGVSNQLKTNFSY